MAFLGHDIDECFLVARLGHVVGWNLNKSQTETTGNLKQHENEIMIWNNKKIQSKSLIFFMFCLRHGIWVFPYGPPWPQLKLH